MPLFSLASALSAEVEAAHQLADRLSETTAFQNLAEAADAAAALTKITVGIAADPFEGDVYSLGELENQHCFALVFSPEDEPHVVGIDTAVLGNPRAGSEISVYIRRQVRESEDRQDAYLFFWDRISAIGQEVIPDSEALASATNRNRFTQITRAIGPSYSERRERGDQGDYLYALLRVLWGDVEAE